MFTVAQGENVQQAERGGVKLPGIYGTPDRPFAPSTCSHGVWEVGGQGRSGGRGPDPETLAGPSPLLQGRNWELGRC